MGAGNPTESGERSATSSRSPPPQARPSSSARPLSIRALVTLIVVLPIAAVAAALVTISIVASRHIAEQLSRELVAGATARVNAEVRRYLGGAIHASDVYARRITLGELPTHGDLRAWERPLLEDLVTRSDVTSICWGSTAGDSTWLLRGRGGRLELGHVPGATGQAVEREVDATTRIIK